MTVADTQTKPVGVGWGSSGPAGSAPSTARPWPAGCRGRGWPASPTPPRARPAELLADPAVEAVLIAAPARFHAGPGRGRRRGRQGGVLREAHGPHPGRRRPGHRRHPGLPPVQGPGPPGHRGGPGPLRQRGHGHGRGQLQRRVRLRHPRRGLRLGRHGHRRRHPPHHHGHHGAEGVVADTWRRNVDLFHDAYTAELAAFIGGVRAAQPSAPTATTPAPPWPSPWPPSPRSTPASRSDPTRSSSPDQLSIGVCTWDGT
jgi:hypothetical protein